jgi:hypothetical protein
MVQGILAVGEGDVWGEVAMVGDIDELGALLVAVVGHLAVVEVEQGHCGVGGSQQQRWEAVVVY